MSIDGVHPAEKPLAPREELVLLDAAISEALVSLVDTSTNREVIVALKRMIGLLGRKQSIFEQGAQRQNAASEKALCESLGKILGNLNTRDPSLGVDLMVLQEISTLFREEKIS